MVLSKLNRINLWLEAKNNDTNAKTAANYDTNYKFGNLFIAIKKSSGKSGAINLQGEEIIPCIYESSRPDPDKLTIWIFTDKDKDFYYSNTGKKIKVVDKN
jgi:hypothetical protein